MSHWGATEGTFRLLIAPLHNAVPTNTARQTKGGERKRMTKEKEDNTSKIHGHKVWPLGVADYSGTVCICLSLETAKKRVENWQN